MRQIRFNGRRCVDELIRPILNLDIVEQFSTEENKNFDPVPLQFESFSQYRDIWIPLFLYETYSQLISSRTDADKELLLLEAKGLKVKPDDKSKKHFEGYIQRNSFESHFIELKLFQSTKGEQDK